MSCAISISHKKSSSLPSNMALAFGMSSDPSFENTVTKKSLNSSHTCSIEFTNQPFLSCTEPTVAFPLALLLTYANNDIESCLMFSVNFQSNFGLDLTISAFAFFQIRTTAGWLSSLYLRYTLCFFLINLIARWLIQIFFTLPPFLSRVSILTRDIDIYSKSVRPSVCLSVHYVRVSDENGLTYRHSFSTIR